MGIQRAAQWAALAVVVSTGCGDKREAAPSASPAPTPIAPAPSDAAAAAADALAPPPPAELSDEELRRYLQHLRAGRALEKRGKLAEARAELDAAIAIQPHGARALSELGWVAFQLGDLDRAREANLAAVKLAADPNVAAASQYNLGRIAEQRGDRDQAREHYLASLRLRASAAVQKRLAALGVEAAAAIMAPPPCAAPVTEVALCTCLSRAADPELEFGCEPTGAELDGLQLWKLTEVSDYWYQAEAYFLVLGRGATFRAVAGLGPTAYEERDLDQSGTLIGLDAHTVAGHRYYRLELERVTSSGGESWVRTETTTRLVTYCVPDGDGVRCPLLVPERSDTAIELEDRDPEYEASFRDRFGKASPIRRGHRLAVTVAADGTATIARVRGARKDLALYLGTTRLW